MKATYNPETDLLDTEEQWFEDHAGEFKATDNDERLALIAAAKREPIIISEKKQMVSIRLAPSDIRAIKQKAAKMGFAYQALISALVHQYAHDELIMLSEAQKLVNAEV